MNRNRMLGLTAGSSLLALALIGGVVPAANAATPATFASESNQCLVEKARVVHHAEVFHHNEIITPGEAAIKELKERWSREVPAITHLETLFSRVEPGQKEIAYNLYQFSRTNPGQAETFTNFFKFKQVIPASDGVKTYKWKTSVDDYKVKYQYQKQVSGVVQKKTPYGKWENTGETFGWQPWDSIQWSFDDKAVLNSGSHNSIIPMDPKDGVQYRMVTTAYQYTKTGKTEQIKVGSHWEYQWGVNSPGNGWQQTGEWAWETEPAAEQTIYYMNGDWVKDNPGAPWVEFDTKSEGNDDAVAPFTEYRAQDGSATTDASSAGKFKEAAFDGWTEFSNEWFVEQEYIADKTLYLTQFAQGVIGETENFSDATWVLTDDPSVDLSIWTQMVDEHGDPLVRDLIEKEGYTEYYVPGGEPTRELGDTNWTPEDEAPVEGGWSFVDERKFTVKEGTPDTIVQVKVVDKAAWNENIAAKYGDCLATTGGQYDHLKPIAAGGAAILAAGGAALFFGMRRRDYRNAPASQGTPSI